MTINELIEQIGGRKRLEEISKFHSGMVFPPSHDEIELMARALLAVLEANPVGITDHSELGCLLRGEMANVMPPNYRGVDKGDEVYIYTTPPAASVPDGWKLVPTEATPEILQAGITAHYKRQQYQQPEDAKFIGPMESAYNAMLAAAPAPGGDGG